MNLPIDNLWWILALGASFFAAFYVAVNQYLKLDARVLVFWRGVYPALFTTPALFFIELPTNPYFYLAVLICSLIASYIDAGTFTGAQKYGGGVMSRFKPFLMWGGFVIWVIWDETYRSHIITHPSEGIGVMISLILGAIALSFLKKCKISKEALLFYMPFLLAGMLVDPFNKIAMDNSPFWGGVITYVWLQGIIVALSSACVMLRQKRNLKQELFTKNIIWLTIPVAIANMGAGLLKNASMTFAQNPAYVAAIIFISPIWITLFYKLTGHKEDANIYAGFAFVLSAILLVLAVQSSSMG